MFFGCACEKSSLKYLSPGRSSVPLTLTSQSSLCLDFWDLKEAAHAAEATLWFSSETTQVSTQYLGERVSEQLLSTGPVFGFHKNAADEVPCLVGRVRGQKRVGGLGGNLEYRCHGLIFSPRWLFCQHFDHCATKTPTKDIHNKCNFNMTYSGVSKQVETNTTFFLCDSLLKPYRNVFGGNFDTHCLQMASATYLGALLSFQHKLKTWNIPTSVMTCLTGLQPITSLAWWVTTQLDCMRECGLLCVGV